MFDVVRVLSKKSKNKRGTVIIAFAYFVVFILLPLLAVGYDFAMLHVFKLHLDNIAQLAALSCQPHNDGTGNQFRGSECQAVMAQVAAYNLRIDQIKNVKGTPWQADEPSLNESDIGRAISSVKGMQTQVFSLKDEKFFRLGQIGKNYSPSNLENLMRINSKEAAKGNRDVAKFFEFTSASNANHHEISHFSITGVYKPLFVKYLGKKYKEIQVSSSPITVRAVICQGC